MDPTCDRCKRDGRETPAAVEVTTKATSLAKSGEGRWSMPAGRWNYCENCLAAWANWVHGMEPP